MVTRRERMFKESIMKSFDIGVRPFGVPIKIHWSVVFLLALCVGQLGLFGIAAFLLIFLSIMIHEFAHVWVSLRMGTPVIQVIFMALGAAAVLEPSFSYSHRDEYWISIVGPISSFLLALIGVPFLFLFPGSMLIVYFVGLNVLLAVFNILPLYPLDGGRVLNAIIAKRKGFFIALKYTVIVTIICNSILAAVSFAFAQYWMGFVFLVLIWLAIHEKKQAMMRM
jgi:Zn-dependent protease